RGHGRRPADAHAERYRLVGRDRRLRPERRPRRGHRLRRRRTDDAAGAARADVRRVLPDGTRVHGRLRPDPPPPRGADRRDPGGRHRPPRADEPRPGDRRGRRRRGRQPRARPGERRGGRADERPLPSAGLRRGERGMTDLLITGAALLGGTPEDVLVRDGVVAAVGSDAAQDAPADVERIDADGLVLLPGLVDLHTHLRETGREDAETVLTGSAAAAAGGFTAILAMANTTPVTDTGEAAEHVLDLGVAAGLVDVRPIGAVTKGLEGTEL